MNIKLKNINKSFGEKVIFSNFNLDIESGSIVIITGDSGSGKTTLLNIIGTIEGCDGVILYDDKPLKSKKEILQIRRNNISFIFQNYGLIDNETVYDNFKVIQNFKKANKNLIDNVLRKVGLSGFGERKVFELSGGEQQRVAISKAIIKNAALILADEPTASIDEHNKKMVIDLLKKINEEGKTIIIVTHDLDFHKHFKNPHLVNIWSLIFNIFALIMIL